MQSWMEVAYQQALQAQQLQEVPVGAVLVDSVSGTLLTKAHNLTENKQNVTAHAEMLVIQQASFIRNNKYLDGCDLYVTLEPCPMCAAALSFARIRRIYFGAYDVKSGALEHGPRLYQFSALHHKPEVIGGIMEQECGLLLSDFFKNLR